jgi:hypothetical protein
MLQPLKRVNWRIFTILFVAGVVGVIAILPYMVDLLGGLPRGQGAATDIPLPLVVALTLLQNGILLAAVIVIGMLLSERIGLQMPLIRAWATGEATPKRLAILLPGMVVGAAIGALLVGVDATLFMGHLPEAMHSLFEIPLWKRLAAGILYGGMAWRLR